jgi:hypothetical protein
LGSSGLAENKTIAESDFRAVARALILQQELMLDATHPRPSGIAVTNDCDELVRRMGIIIDTWPDRKRGEADARSSADGARWRLLASVPMNDAERAYAAALESRFGVYVQDVARTTTNYAELAYIYGFNTEMPRLILRQHKREEFQRVIKETLHDCTWAKGGEFFVPWPFAFGKHAVHGRVRGSRPAKTKREEKRRRRRGHTGRPTPRHSTELGTSEP